MLLHVHRSENQFEQRNHNDQTDQEDDANGAAEKLQHRFLLLGEEIDSVDRWAV